MSELNDILPGKVKFKKVPKYRGRYSTAPAISVPRLSGRGAYLNRTLVEAILGSNYKKVHFHLDPENRLIAIEPTNDIDGYIISSPKGNNAGCSTTAKVTKDMPQGRYEFDEETSTKNFLVFALLERSTRHGKKA